ncbi:MAG: transposase, partial [Actinomycetota bacterium]|nr:transposase [Actinomycetota bacterium]
MDSPLDRYHVLQHLSQAIDEVRRAEAKQHQALLKNTRYLWLKRPANPTERQHDWLDELLCQPLETVRACEHALRFDAFYEIEDPDTAEERLRRWIAEVDASGLLPLQKFARMLEDHWLFRSGPSPGRQTNFDALPLGAPTDTLARGRTLLTRRAADPEP